MSTHRYPNRVIMTDYLRAGIGALLSLVPLAAVPIASIAGTVLSFLAVLFVFFGGRTWVRSRTVAELFDEGLDVAALRVKTILWRDITSLELRYFATKRDRSQGWMQLTLRSATTTLRLESSLDGFDRITRAAAHAAIQNHLSLSPSTIENLRSLDLPTDHLQKISPAVTGAQ